MARTLYLTDLEIEAITIAVEREVTREGEGKDPYEVHIRYLSKLLEVRDKINPKK